MFNYKTWNKLKFWLVIAGVFLFGIIVASSTKTETKEIPVEVVKEVVREVPKEVEKKVEVIKEVEVEVCPNEDTWKELKEIDDEGFKKAAEGFRVVSDIFTALENLDFEAVDFHTKRLGVVTDETTEITAKRAEILNELGY